VNHYVLPELPYDYGALEPHISGEIMELHHDKHHRTYVDGANQAMAQLADARGREDYARLAALEHYLAFNVSGHVLHSLFWQNLSPDGGDRPNGQLAQQIDQDFGSFDGFKQQMIRAASTITGSGWAALSWDPASGRLITLQIHDHQSQTAQGSMPLLVLDAWEHAYYLQYRNEKAKFFEAVWNLWNWDDVSTRYLAARNVNLNLAQIATSSGRGKR
jgi:superoxide dismutase, Fe-Mn family